MFPSILIILPDITNSTHELTHGELIAFNRLVNMGLFFVFKKLIHFQVYCKISTGLVETTGWQRLLDLLGY